MNDVLVPDASITVKAEKLIGTYHKVGAYGPVYQVASIVSSTRAKIVLVETGEEVIYAIEDILQDPQPNS
jgi:hypothetical protein